MSEVHVWESSQIWRREDGAIVEDRQGKHYSSDPNEAFIHVVLLADYTALRAEVERLTGCLTQANAQAERFERQWYLRGDELDRLRAALKKIRDMAFDERLPDHVPGTRHED